MKALKAVIKIVSFTLILTVVMYILSSLAKPDNHNLRNIRGLYGEKENSIDVVCIGGSSTFVYYAPVKSWVDHGIVSYDYANDSISAELYAPMIREVLKTQDPKLIVIDARAFQYRDLGYWDSQPPNKVSYRNTLTGMKLSLNKIDFIRKNVGTHIEDKKLSYYFDVITYHDNIVLFNNNTLQMLRGTFRNRFRGFFFIPEVREMPVPDCSTKEKKAVTPDTQAVLTDLLDYMDSTGRDYLFVIPPYSEIPEHKMAFNYVQEIIEQHGYPFLDCNEYVDQMHLDYTTDVYNECHVNIFGAEKYTDFLNQYLLSHYDIPDRRGDPAYTFMNDYLDDWSREVAETKEKILTLLKEE